MRRRATPPAFTIVELMAVTATMTIMTALLLPVIGLGGQEWEQGPAHTSGTPSAAAPDATTDDLVQAEKPPEQRADRSLLRASISRKEMVRLRGVMQAMMVYANDNDGRFTTPGLMVRKPIDGMYIPGVGEPQHDMNYTGAIASILVASTYTEPELWVSPAENNPLIGVKGVIAEAGGQPITYDYMSYAPHKGSCFDTSFRSRLGDEKVDHCSFSNMSLVGPKRRGRWANSSGSDTLAWTTRGTIDGDTNHPDHAPSPVLEMHDPINAWSGHAVTCDGAVIRLDDFHPDFVRYPVDTDGMREFKPDNIFACEFSTKTPGDKEAMQQGDTWMTYSYAASAGDDMLSHTFDPIQADSGSPGTKPNAQPESNE